MDLRRERIFRLFLAFWILFFVSACVPVLKSNAPELEARAEKIKKISLLSPEIEISEVSAGGMKELRDDWCLAGTQNVVKALSENLKQKGVSVQVLKARKRQQKEIEEINALYRAVTYSIVTHTYWIGQNPNIFPERVTNFDYSVGSVENLLKKEKADGMLIVYGVDEISTTGRKALRAIKAINPFDQAERAGMTSLVIALTDAKGDILWFRTMTNAGGYDLRKDKSANKFVRILLDDFPGGGK